MQAPPDPIERLREELRALDRAYSRGHHGRWSGRRRAGLVDECVRKLFSNAAAEAPARVALVALGGYGRASLAPASDVDLMVLHTSPGSEAVGALAERLFYPLWDAGFAVGNAVRTADECVAVAAERLDAATALLDARLLAGDEDLFASMHERVREAILARPREFVADLERAEAERRERFGSVSHVLEPDVKEGAGGLRDVQTLGWVAAAVTEGGGLRGLEAEGLMRSREREAVEAAEEYLTRLRSALHLERGKKADVVLLDDQPALARDLGFDDEPGLAAEDGLMRSTFEHARAVEHVSESVFGRVLAPRVSVPLHLDQTPASVLRVFAAAAAGDGSVPPDLLDRVESVELPEEIAWTPGMRDDLLAMLRAGESGVAALEAMDRAGLLARFLPEWAAVRCRPQRDPYHRFTVDVHLLRTLSGAAALLEHPPVDDPVARRAASAVGDPDGFLLGALLHDIGKTGHGGHVAAGATVAASALDRVGVPEPSRSLVVFLVEQHLLLADTATRRDLEDEDLVLDVAARIGDPERLAALYLLTVADAAATGPHAWTPWRAALIRELTAKVQHVLERGQMGGEQASRLGSAIDAIREALGGEDPEAVERFLGNAPRQYLLSVPADLASRHFHLMAGQLGAADVRTWSEPGVRSGTYALTVVARDQPGLLSRIAGSLALSGLSILTAQAFTTEDGVALDLFEVEGAFEGDVDEERWRRFRTTLRHALEGRVALEYRVREKRGYYGKPRTDIPVTVKVDNDASDFFTVVEVGAADRIGLLFDISRALADLQLDVHFAKVATYGERVVDAFYVRDALGRKVEDEGHAREIDLAITASLTE